jgi:hypothetical protein
MFGPCLLVHTFDLILPQQTANKMLIINSAPLRRYSKKAMIGIDE